MGGMIVQILAIEHPERVRSLTSIMSTTGNREVGEATPEAFALLTSPPATTREEVLDHSVLDNRLMGSPAFPVAEKELRDRVARAFDRCYYPDGVARQLQACLTMPDRTAALGRVEHPALVIHGVADPLISVSGGRATAAAIPSAELLEIDGMGHDLPAQVWPTVVDRIVELIDRTEPGRVRIRG
jgi:pimeloyl-ACP methyl ester carboxylesterase